jgi:tol-pal system protein YbgF
MLVSKRLAWALGMPLGLVCALAVAEPIVIEDHPLSTADAPATAAATAAKPPLTASPIADASPAPSNNNGNFELYQQVQELQQQVQGLQGVVDEQRHLIERLRNDNKSRYTDLDQRLNGLSDRMGQLQQAPAPAAGSGTPATTTPATAPQSSGNIDEEKKSYLAAYDIFRSQGPDKAIPPMLAFVGRYPNSIFTPNGYYWLGEFYLAATPSSLPEARRHFETVLSKYPESAKAPAALYKLGTIEDLQNHPDAAKKRMQELLQRFPGSPEAGLAQSYLNPAKATDTPAPAAASAPVTAKPATKPVARPPVKKKKTEG